MADSKRFYGLPWGLVTVVLGPPKTGKSSFAGSVAEVVPAERIALLCTKANEANSFMYRKHGLSERAEIFFDKGWDPEFGEFKPTGFRALNERIRALRGSKDIDAIIVDAGTDAMDMLSHSILAGMRVGDAQIPGNVGELRQKGAKDASFSYYDKMRVGAQQFMNRIVECAMDPLHPKFIIIPWHTQAPSDEEQEKAGGIGFEGKVLPMVEGKYRQKLAGDVDLVLYSDIKRSIVNGKPAVQHIVQVAPTNEKHAAIRSIALGSTSTFPNDFKSIHAELVKGV
jgi:hypothetical protein